MYHSNYNLQSKSLSSSSGLKTSPFFCIFICPAAFLGCLFSCADAVVGETCHEPDYQLVWAKIVIQHEGEWWVFFYLPPFTSLQDDPTDGCNSSNWGKIQWRARMGTRHERLGRGRNSVNQLSSRNLGFSPGGWVLMHLAAKLFRCFHHASL